MRNVEKIAALKAELAESQKKNEELYRFKAAESNARKEVARLHKELAENISGIRAMSGVVDAALLSLAFRFGITGDSGESYILAIPKADMEQLKAWDVTAAASEDGTSRIVTARKKAPR